jgi:hypothetical protein
MKSLTAILALVVCVMLANAAADEGTTMRPMSSKLVRMDLDRNGKMDSAQLGIEPDRARLAIELNNTLLPIIDIPIDGSKEFGICPGAMPKISVVPQSEAPLNALGESPEGYSICAKCVEIVVAGGECDSLQFYWNVVANNVSWWRA